MTDTCAHGNSARYSNCRYTTENQGRGFDSWRLIGNDGPHD